MALCHLLNHSHSHWVIWLTWDMDTQQDSHWQPLAINLYSILPVNTNRPHKLDFSLLLHLSDVLLVRHSCGSCPLWCRLGFRADTSNTSELVRPAPVSCCLVFVSFQTWQTSNTESHSAENRTKHCEPKLHTDSGAECSKIWARKYSSLNQYKMYSILTWLTSVVPLASGWSSWLVKEAVCLCV